LSDQEQIDIFAYLNCPQRRVIETDIEDSLLLFRGQSLREEAVGLSAIISGQAD
jgi:hypothetical protein